MASPSTEIRTERYPGERLSLLERIPTFVRSVLLSTAGKGALGYLLNKRSGTEVHGLLSPGDSGAVAGRLLASVVAELPGKPLPFTDGHFDAIVLGECFGALEADTTRLCLLAPLLAPAGLLYVVLPNAEYGGQRDASLPVVSYTVDAFVAGAATQGLHLYTHWTHPAQKPFPAGEEPVTGLDRDPVRCARAACIDFLLVFVRAGYDPLVQARAFLDGGRPDYSYEVLEFIPESYRSDPESIVVLEGEKLLSLLHWLRAVPPGQKLPLLSRAQRHFYSAIATAPRLHGAYQCQAEIWHGVGDDAMAGRLLRSIHFAAPDPAVEQRLLSLMLPRARLEDPPPPEWDHAKGPHRVLMLMPLRPHYGLDVLYDGLHSVLGGGNVIEYPYKPWLHGVEEPTYRNYPCSFTHPGEEMSLEQLLDELRAGRFDALLYGNCENEMDRDLVQRIVQAAGDIPFAVLDQIDEFVDTRPLVRDYAGREDIAVYFKREMLACVDYGPDVFPLPFAYPESRVPEEALRPRERDFFWAGHRQFGLRRLYLEYLEESMGRDLKGSFPPEIYSDILQETRIALNCFGCGFDTVRYWEIPAHGAMLLAERLPIRIPLDFRDGREAVFFDDLESLATKLRYYLARPEEAAAIAAAGREHFLRHHTGAARARQMLGWIQAVL